MIVAKIENGLERGFVKLCRNCHLITDPYIPAYKALQFVPCLYFKPSHIKCPHFVKIAYFVMLFHKTLPVAQELFTLTSLQYLTLSNILCRTSSEIHSALATWNRKSTLVLTERKFLRLGFINELLLATGLE